MTDQQTNSDARRERYAAAIQREATGGITLNAILPEVYVAADAAMAVADEDIAEALRISDAATNAMLDERRSENERLRAELEQQKKLRAIAEERHLTASERADEALSAVARVRAVLELKEQLDDPVSRYVAAELRTALEEEDA